MALNPQVAPPRWQIPFVNAQTGMLTEDGRRWVLQVQQATNLKLMRGTLPIPAELTESLTEAEDGLIYESSDYQHRHRWNSATGKWEFAPGDNGAGYSVTGLSSGGKWQVCDGSTVPVAQPDGTLADITAPVSVGAYMRR